MNRQNLAGLYLLVDRVGGLTKLPEVTAQQNALLLLQPQKILHAPSPCYFPGVRAVVHTFAVPTESENRQHNKSWHAICVLAGMRPSTKATCYTGCM